MGRGGGSLRGRKTKCGAYPYPNPYPYPSDSELSRLLTFRFLELVAPTKDTRLGAVMLGLGLVAPLHPDAGHRGVDVDVLRAQREGLLAGGEPIVAVMQHRGDLVLKIAAADATAQGLCPRGGAESTADLVALSAA